MALLVAPPQPDQRFDDDDALGGQRAAAAAEPEPDAGAGGPLTVSTRVEYSSLPRGESRNVFGLVTVQAATAPASSPKPERQPMDVVCVLDVSGSMQGAKLTEAQQAVRFIVDQAEPCDRLGIVSFSSLARRELRLRRMTAEGKDDAHLAALRLAAGGGTSITAGLRIALAMMEQRRERNQVSALLLLTDGQDSSTYSQLPELTEQASKAGCSLYAFGFGADHDAALLSEIAERAQTPFTFVEDAGQIREAFAGTIGGLASVVAQGVELTLRCQAALKAVHTPFTVRRDSPEASEATVLIPDIFAGERRDVLVELSVPAGGNGPAVLLEASALYTDLQRGVVVRTPTVAMEAERVEEPQPEMEPDEEVTEQRERVEVTLALRQASAASDGGRFDEARKVLDSAELRVRARRKTAMGEALAQELELARQRMCNRVAWERGGRATVCDATQMHLTQRCTNMSMPSRAAIASRSKSMYCSATQEQWIERSRSTT